MNSELLPNSYSIDFALNQETKYLGQERTYQNPTAFAPSEFLIPRRGQHCLNSASLGQTLGVSSNNGLNFNSGSSIPDLPFHSGSQLLSPAASIDESHTAGIQPPSSAYNFLSTSKSLTSNASSTDHFTPSLAQYSHSPWNDSTMTDFQRLHRPPVLHPQMSPRGSFGPSNITGDQYLSPPQRTMSHTLPGPFPPPRSFNELPHNPFYSKHPRSPIMNHTLPMPGTTPYTMHGPYHPQTTPPMRSEGPPFEDTTILHQLVTATHQPLHPEIHAHIQKGFFQVDDKWTCYRRNYFAVFCAFNFKHGNPPGSVYLQKSTSQTVLVHQYAISLAAKTATTNNQESEDRQLVQHTPKRDKATETTPGRHVVQPAPAHAVTPAGVLPPGAMYPGHQHLQPPMGQYEGFVSHSQQVIPTSHTFERIQFQKATANNGKRRAQQQYFHIVVQLSVNVGLPNGDEWITIATKLSNQVVVRGRSPGHYKDNIRRDGQTNMDPDHDNSHNGDIGPNNLPLPYLGSNQSSSMDWNSSHRQGHHHYGNPYGSKYASGPAWSPQSASTCTTTLTASPNDDDYSLSTFSTTKLASPYELHRQMPSPISQRNRDLGISFSSPFSHHKKLFDDDESDTETGLFQRAGHQSEAFSPRPLEVGNGPPFKAACAFS